MPKAKKVVKKVTKPAPKKAAPKKVTKPAPKVAKKVTKPVRTAKRAPSKIEKPKSKKKSLEELERKLGKKLGNKKKTQKPEPKRSKPLTRAEKIKKADKKVSRKTTLRKPSKSVISPIEDIKQKFLTESESKEVKSVTDALKRRLQKVSNYARKVLEEDKKLNGAIQAEFGFDPRLNLVEMYRTKTRELGTKQKLHKIDETEAEASFVNNINKTGIHDELEDEIIAAAPPAGRPDQGYVAREIKNLNMRAGAKAVFADALDPLKHMFGGKERAIVTFSNVGRLQETKFLNEKGKLEHAYYGTVLANPIFDDASEWTKLVNLIATRTGMRYLPQIKPKHVMSAAALRQFVNSPGEFNFFKRNGAPYAFFAKVENDVVYGCYIAYANSIPGNSPTDSTPGAFLIGYWCGVGMTISEMKTLTMGRFDEHFESANPDPRTTQFIGQSMMTQFFNSRNRSLQISVADISLTRDFEIDKGVPDFIGKSESGSILYVPNVDLRDKFDDWVNDRTLPEELSTEDYVPGTNLTEQEYFAGRVVYTDMKHKIMFYYTKSGDLHKFDFSSAAELNTRDKAELTKQKSFSPEYIKEHRSTQSFYGTSFFFTEQDYRVIVDPTAARATFEEFVEFKFQGFREDDQGAQRKAKLYGDNMVLVTIEGLRESYNGDKEFFEVIEQYYEELQLNAAYYYSHGHRDVIPKDETDLEEETGRFTDAALRRAPMIGMMLAIARKSYEEWPHENDLRKRAEEQLQKMTAPSREDLDAVIGTFDGLIKDKNGNYPKLMPHQVETLAVMRNTNTAALDVDMGGGKTIMAVLDMSRLIREGITLENGDKASCRPLVVMPGAKLVRNYIDDVKKFFGTNFNIFVLETDSTVKNAVSNNELVERMQNAPVNTIFVTTYSWLTGGGAYDVTLNTEINKKTGDLKIFSKRVFPRVEMLKRVPITAVYLDESHKIKNKTSKQNAAAVALSSVPVKRLLTGTMVSKDASDIFQQMRFLDSTLVGSEARFIAQYGANDDDDDSSSKKKKKAKRGDLRPGAEKEARAELRSNGVLQLRRSSWLPLLPEKEEKFFFVDMSKEHEAIYKSMLMKLVATPLKAYEKGLITYEQYQFLTKLNAVLNVNGDDDDGDDSLLGGRAGAILGDKDDEEDGSPQDDDEEGDQGGRGAQAQNMVKVQQNMAVMMAAMQDFLTAPELLNPKTFDNDPAVLEALRNAGLLDESGDMIGFSVGPKDQMIKELIIKHFESTGGRYIKRSEQNRRFGNDKSRYAGKVIIFHYNVNAATHFYNMLKKAGIQGVGMYQADKNLHKQSDAHLDAFKDPENDEIGILCAAEGAILLGQNMQSANMVIRSSTPWTTGDYDQSIARAFRNGQDLNVTAINIQVNSSFEVLKLIKLFVRESSNRKLNSDFDVPFEISKALGECSLENHVEFATEDALRNFPVNRYARPGHPEAGMYEDKANLFVELHDEIWKQEKLAAYGPDEKRARAKDPSYLNDPNNNCEAARYHRLGLDTMTEMATGEDKIQSVSVDVTPKKSNGEYATHGELAYDGLDSLFNGFVDKSERGQLKKLKYQELRKIVRSADPGTLLRANIEECFDAIVEAKPSYSKLYAARRDEIVDELYKDFTNTDGKKSKDYNLFTYVGPHEAFIRGIYNMVVSRYKSLALAELDLGKSSDLKMNVKRSIDNAKKLAGIIDSFRKVNGDPEDNAATIDDETNDENNEVRIDEEEEDPIEETIERDTLVVGLSKYFSDFAESATDDDAQLMLFAPISEANPLAKKLPRFHLPSGKTFAKRVRYVYTKSPISSATQMKSVLQKIESVGGVIEAKDERGRYSLLDSMILKALLSSKAPSTKQADSAHSVHNIMRDKGHHVTARTAGGKKQNIDCGFIVLDGRITLAAFPDGDKAIFKPAEENILRQCGFRRIEYMVVMYKVTEPQKKKLHRDLIALATKFNGDGVIFHNEERFEKHVKFFTKTQVDYASERE
jgi:hypothetical protein